MLAVVKRPVSLTHYRITKIEGGSGPEQSGNDALASVAVSVEQMSDDDAGSSMPNDFPGSLGVVAYKTEAGGVKVTNTSKRLSFNGLGTSTDIVVASARAYLAALNRLLASEQAAEKRGTAQ